VAARLAGPIDHLIDRAGIASRPGAILHPTYYRDPATLPRDRPLVVTVHDMTHERFPEIGRRRWWGRADAARHKPALVRRAHRIVCYSKATRDDLVGMLGTPAERVRVIPLAGDSLEGVAAEPLPAARPPFLLWVGERHTYKNFDRTLAAWARSPAAADTRLVCVGGPPLDTAERTQIAVLGVSDRVWQGACGAGELRWAYEHAEALLYPSLAEGFGLPVIEALALGAPVVTSDRSSLPEVGGDVAIYVDPESEEAIAAGIPRARAEGRAPERVAARRAQAARFSWARCAAAHESLYAELDGAPGAGGR
jgi:glycosyltransferase involved in cell wall biosynthesis